MADGIEDSSTTENTSLAAGLELKSAGAEALDRGRQADEATEPAAHHARK